MKEGWKVVKLGEVCKIGIGRTPSRSDKSLWDNEKKTNNKWVSIADMTETLNGFIYETKEHISDKAANNIAVIPKGTILLSFKLTLGKTAIAGNDLYTNEAIANLPIITNEINKEYLLYYFQFFNWANYAAGDEKVMGKTLNKKKLEILPVIYPPLPEQHRIVKKLDAAFEKIDAMKAKAEKNIENAKALFQQTLAEELEPKEWWVEKKLGEVCDKVCNIKWQITTDSFKYIDLTSVDRETDNVECCQMINAFNAPSRAKQKVQKGDILFATTRPTLRRLCIINEDYNGAICSTGFCVLRPCSAIHSKWIFYSLKADMFYSYVEPLQKGASYPAITDGDVKCFVVNVPPLPEQQQIVTKLDNLSAKCKKLEEAERKTIAECDALKQAILRQAFNGEL